MPISMHTAAERPDLWERGVPSAEVWPEYNLHGDVLNPRWGELTERFGDYQFVLHDDEADAVVAEGHTAPFAWDGMVESLPSGIDAVFELAFHHAELGVPPTALTALAAETPRTGRRAGMAAELLGAMRVIGQQHRLRHLVAPVRPSSKERYPLTPIERYVHWRRDDGQLLDPWLRVHERLGAKVATTLRESMRITGTVAEWESWTGMTFPETGEYVFPEGLAPVNIDVEADLGSYWEPNVWVIHPDL